VTRLWHINVENRVNGVKFTIRSRQVCFVCRMGELLVTHFSCPQFYASHIRGIYIKERMHHD